MFELSNQIVYQSLLYPSTPVLTHITIVLLCVWVYDCVCAYAHTMYIKAASASVNWMYYWKLHDELYRLLNIKATTKLLTNDQVITYYTFSRFQRFYYI